MKIKDKTVVLGVTGGIAAYKACEIVSALRKAGASVHVIMTQNACEFVTPLTFETLSNHPVVTDMFDRNREWEVEHVSLAKRADVFLIAPCTANVIGKIAHGIADDFLTTTVMATKAPLVIAPAMNTGMYESAAYQSNAAILKGRGAFFVEPGCGRLACGDVGKGRLEDPATIVAFVDNLLTKAQDCRDKTFLITVGSTSEPVDPVRSITNRSSGKMGAALADAALSRGGNVILVAGEVSVQLDERCEIHRVRDTRSMMDAVLGNMDRAQYIIKCAAPADYAIENVSETKLKGQTVQLNLRKNPDIAAAVGARKGKKKLVIFAAETQDLILNAKEKMKKKQADMVVANNVATEGAGFGSDTNIVSILTKDQTLNYEKMDKRILADIILDHILAMK